ncbi:MAG: patatin-like phospholipase family protein [Burkholderiaceae bacterium]|nr:patatin-like phospholipase family protein [Burkholderiaceae bacterium]
MNARPATRPRARPPRTVRRPVRIGMALAGGGPLGAIYEIGALAALSEALHGIDLNHADVYVGVSAGSFIAAGLVNGFSPHQLSRVFIEGQKSADRFDPAILLRPALREYWQRLRSLPPLAAQAAFNYLLRPGNLMGSIERLGRAIPTGLFSGDEVDRYLSRIFNQPGRSNDFRQLPHKLYLVATDLDTGESVAFGGAGTEHVPVSRAVQASAALPGVFPPVEIEGRYFVDGALRKTLHASIALEQGIDLMLCLNPLVPYDARPTHRARDRDHRLGKLVEGGLPVVLAQTYRSIIHSRLGAGLERYKVAYPDTDIILFEPNRSDADMFFTNLFSYSSRRRLCEHAYQKTRQELWNRRHELAPRLARHGVEINVSILRDESLTLVKSIRRQREALLELDSANATRQLTHTLDDLERYLKHVYA